MPYQLPLFKTCTVCGELKPATAVAFYQNKATRDGLANQCKDCRRIYEHTYRRTHREEKKIYNAKYRRAHSDEEQVYDAAYHIAHRKEINARSKSWLRAHSEEKKNYNIFYNIAHREEKRASGHKRRAKKRSLPHAFAAQDWSRALAYWNGACAYCRHGPSLFDRNFTLHQEHFVPVVKNGGYIATNILPACQSCNFSKQDRDYMEWGIDRFGKKRAEQILKRIQDYFEWVSEQDG